MRRFIIAVTLALIPVGAFAQQPAIQVENAWSRGAAAGGTGVVYLTVTDSGAPDRLTGAASPVAASAALHESINDNGIRKMRPVASLPVESGKTLKLSPGGYHIMLEGLKQALTAGQSFPVTLSFEKAGPIVATVSVRQGGAHTMDHGHMDMHGMMDMR
jgi:copper(I)-binding protein